MEWIRRGDEWIRVPENRAIAFAVILCLAIGLVFVSPWITTRFKEMGMSRRAKRIRQKSVRETICDSITDSIEKLVASGDIEAEDRDWFYKKLHGLGYKGLGNEPTFGKPWFEKGRPPHPAWVKARIILRRNKGGAAPKLP